MGKKLFRKIRQVIRRLSGISTDYASLLNEIHGAKLLTAKLLINQMQSQGMYETLQQAEFKVFSQFGDDGIIQYLVTSILQDNKRNTIEVKNSIMNSSVIVIYWENGWCRFN